jgi:HK97 family phage major capsid protein
LNGTGSAAFGGIVGIRTKMVDGNHAASYTDAVAGNDQFGEYDIGDFLVARPRPLMSAGYTPSWYCSRQGSMLDMDRLSFAQGGSNGQELRTGFGNVFIGDPVQLSQKMPIVTTALNELVAFLYGDMKQAVAFGSRDVFTIGQTSERYFEYDQTGFRATERFDINVHDIGDGSSAGPLVGIRGNTS